MFFVDKDLRRLINSHEVIILSTDGNHPFDPEKQIGPGSIDLRLSHTIRKYKPGVSAIDLEHANLTELVRINEDEEITILPGELILATTLEVVSLPAEMAGIIMGRSSISRLGLLIHVSQEFMQPGHQQLVPLQLVNVTKYPIKIKPLIHICQIMLIAGSSKAEYPYNVRKDAKYRGELIDPEASKIGMDLNMKPASQDLLLPNNSKAKEIKEQLEQKQSMIKKDGLLEGTGRTSEIMTLIFIVLGAGISLMIEELDVKPFPSLKLIIGGAFALLCISIIMVAYWRKN